MIILSNRFINKASKTKLLFINHLKYSFLDVIMADANLQLLVVPSWTNVLG